MNKQAVFATLDGKTLPAVLNCLRSGFVVVLVGATGSGKSVIASKALPLATVVTGLNGAFQSVGKMASDLIGEELFDRVSPDEFIRSRNQALALGYRVIITGQRWQDVLPYLAALTADRYRVFDLNRVWEAHGRPYCLPNSIPEPVLARPL